MGLCKCPKRKVTNQFCFEHRVNVCESCMVSNHPKCVVQSYCQWLKDSDYSSLCALCTTDLSQDDCIRLICYHVFHSKCLDTYCRQYPLNTAPAGYACPSCSSSIFPASNLVSPVADVLRSVLANRPWAREGLGLPLLPFDPSIDSKTPETHQVKIAAVTKKEGTNYSVVNVEGEASSAIHRNEPVIHTNKRPIGLLTGSDRDESINKYKRRPPWETFKRMIKNLLDPHSRNRQRGHFRRRYALLLVIAVFVIVFIFAVGSRIFNSPDGLGSAPMDVPFNHRVA
uniref:Zinc finger protein-like 1 homolog n=1 Tax=Megafenestra aurita TaxID=2291010 RepID=A0A4Y7NJ04_9CRUS|nr:EOG090X0ASS [Megafenestra aurita]SVE92567.1 EOG090X0ASS [Megafenestra aurita]